MPYSTLAVLYSLLAGLLAMILVGKGWARAVYTVFAAYGLLSLLLHIAEVSTTGLLVEAAKVFAVLLLYAPISAPWFKRHGPENSFEPEPQRGGSA